MNRLLWLLLVLTNLRGRLRCPWCQAVGTYKLFAPCINSDGSKVPWRWLCKYCGYYRSKLGEGRLCYPSKKQKVWQFLSADVGDETKLTPKQLMEQQMPWCWPWTG